MTLRNDLEKAIADASQYQYTGQDARSVAFLRDHGPALFEAVRDAERYRWLREESSGQFEYPIAVSQRREGDTMVYIGPLVGDDLDFATDAAREGEKG